MILSVEDKQFLKKLEKIFLSDRYYHYKKLVSKKDKNWNDYKKIFKYEVELSRKSRERNMSIYKKFLIKDLIAVIYNMKLESVI